MDPLTLKTKICLVGDLAVGKTSLIRRFVQDAFDDRYLTTLGTKVSKKVIEVSPPGHVTMKMDMLIWDIMGQHAFQELLKDSYFYGVRGILAVADLTRKATLDDIDMWVDLVEGVAGRVPMILAVNKADLEGEAAATRAEIESVGRDFECDVLRTSAKTGENIEETFRRLADAVAIQQLASRDDGS